jgi:hypothetical protein
MNLDMLSFDHSFIDQRIDVVDLRLVFLQLDEISPLADSVAENCLIKDAVVVAFGNPVLEFHGLVVGLVLLAAAHDQVLLLGIHCL